MSVSKSSIVSHSAIGDVFARAIFSWWFLGSSASTSKVAGMHRAAKAQVGAMRVAGHRQELGAAVGRMNHGDAATVQRADADVAVGLHRQRVKALVQGEA